MGRPVARLMVSNQNLRVSWKPVNPKDCVWKNLSPNHDEDHIAGNGENSFQHQNLVHKGILKYQAMKIPAAKAASGQGMGKLENSGVGPDKSQK